MNDFAARRMTQRYVQQFMASPDRLFPLLCPVREYEWVESWQCEMLYSASGVAEKNCVFRTHVPGDSSDDVWVISRHDPYSLVEFVRVNPLRVISLSIALIDNGDGTTTANNEQVLTALTPDGNRILDGITDTFVFEMRMGEAMLNHYLTTGKRLPLKDAVARAKSLEQ
ncbi:hypothetical protein [Nitrospira defluvii]|uniref:Uncharacterized protein n=1 Tax=Nitrospira defluvii TaxID=330214 RepID=A0ABN7LRJ1_9BACT|nr:hypothetical protein [Nitrospira defluvii]CAE6761264.1 conserved hypothetical protein [Nitrospira defluvii]